MATMHEFAMANGNAALPVKLPEPTPASPAFLKSMYTVLQHDRTDFDRCHDYVNGKHLLPFAPRDSSEQIRDLQQRSVTNLMNWLVALPAQVSFVDGYRRGGNADVVSDEGDRFTPEYDVWQKERMDARQATIYRAAFTYGHSFVHLNTLGPDPKIEVLPTRHTVAFFDDPVNDIRPAYCMTVKSQPNADDPGFAIYWDGTHRYELNWTLEREFTVKGDPIPHGSNGCPVVRYTCEIDDEGTTSGVVLKHIPLQDRINQSVFSTNITSDFGAFKVRTAAGLVPNVRMDPETGEPLKDAAGNYLYEPVVVSQARMLLSDDPNTKFGQLDETPLDGYLKAEDQAIKNLASIAQLPVHALMGSVSNLSAEALSALEAQFRRFCDAFQTSAGESHEELFRMIALAIGDAEGANAYGGEVRWRDMDQKSFGAVVDGLGKLVESVGIPRRGAWALVPGVTSGTLKDWEALKLEEADDDMFAEPRDTVTSGRERVPTE